MLIGCGVGEGLGVRVGEAVCVAVGEAVGERVGGAGVDVTGADIRGGLPVSGAACAQLLNKNDTVSTNKSIRFMYQILPILSDSHKPPG